MRKSLTAILLALLTLLAILGSAAPATSALSLATAHHASVIVASVHSLDYCAGGATLPC